MKCKYGKLKNPVRERGKLRSCKLNPNRKINKNIRKATYGSRVYHRMKRRKK